MMASQTLKSVYFTKAQKSRYFKNKIFFLQIKKFINHTSRATLLQKNSFVEEVTHISGIKDHYFNMKFFQKIRKK